MSTTLIPSGTGTIREVRKEVSNMSDVKEIKLDAQSDEEFGIEELPSYEVALIQGCGDMNPY